MKTLIIILFVTYLAMCFCIYILQRRMLYFPVPVLGIKNIPSITINTGEVRLNGYVVNEHQERALIYYGGNAEQIEQNIELFEVATPNHTVYLFPYRGYGGNPGEPNEKALYKDAEAVYDELAKKHSSISLMGRSLGSGVATYIAANRPVDKLILVTPYDSIENVAKESYWMFPVQLLIKDRFPSWKRAKNIEADTLVLVAGADEVISRARSDNLIKHLPADRTKVVVLYTAMHNDISVYPTYLEEITLLLEKDLSTVHALEEAEVL